MLLAPTAFTALDALDRMVLLVSANDPKKGGVTYAALASQNCRRIIGRATELYPRAAVLSNGAGNVVTLKASRSDLSDKPRREDPNGEIGSHYR
jgi:hypothetical protein